MADALQLELKAMPFNLSGISYGNFSLDANNDALEFIFPAREAVAITRLGFRYGVRTGTPPEYRISLQGVNTSGNPDGTVKGGVSPASALFTPPADATWNGTWQWVNLANSYTPASRGEMLALVIDYSSGTVDASNFSSFTSNTGTGFDAALPFAIGNAAGSRSRSNLVPVFGYGSAGEAYGFPMEGTGGGASFSSASSPDEHAVKFTIPSSWCSTFKVAGARVQSAYAAGGSVVFTLYDGTTALQTVTLDTDHVRAASTAGYVLIYFDEASLSTLNSGTAYRFGIAPASGTHTLYGLQVDADGDMSAYPLEGNMIVSTRTDAGAWTDVGTRRLAVDLILDDITAPAGGGGTVPIPVSMSGGLLV